MKIIYNNIIPFKGFKAINICGILFARKGVTIDDTTINHESIHTKQMIETLFIFFYVWYVIEYLIKLCYYGHSHEAYRAISFEREAYMYQSDMDYLSNRKHFKWMNFIFN